ncbi:MAG: M20/M25/M40 family metallo-hydrolase [Clostridia bacterium]|nr:M20/M25/M40 family metallo-hydrolase [Clostridia bacterium]
MRPNKQHILMTFTMIITILIAFYSLFSLYISPKSDFQDKRAMKHLEQISKAPHSVGMKEHDNVRKYIISQLNLLGVKWELQEDLSYIPITSSVANIKNIIATIPGKNPGKTVAVVAHYDSVPMSYGTNDDGSSVAAMLECIAILKDKPALKNDLIFLFTDGEETGLHGMNAFMANHALGKNIDFVLNFEAGGSSGPSLMFETTPGNLNTVRAFHKASSNIISYSVLPRIRKIIPDGGSSDYNIAKKMNIQGLNFAYNCDRRNYHNYGDSLGHVSMASFQQQGHHMISCIRYFGNADIDSMYKTNKDGVFFSVFNILFIIYSQDFMVILKIFVLLLAFTSFLFAFVKKIITVKEVFIGFIAQLFIGILLFFSLPLIQKGSIIFGKDIYAKLSQARYSSIPLFILMSLFVCLIVFIVYIPLTKKLNTTTLLSSSLIWWILLSGVTLFYLKEGSYLFDWVLLSGSLGLLSIALSKDIIKKTGFKIALLIPFWLGIIIMYPSAFLFTENYMLLQFKISALFIYLILILAMHQLHDMIKRKWLFAFVLLLVCGSFVFVENKTSDSLFAYDMNAADYYYSEDINGKVDVHWSVFANTDPTYRSLEKDNEKLHIPMPKVELVSESEEKDNRILTFKIKSPLPSAEVVININNQEGNIKDILLNDKYGIGISNFIVLQGSGLKEDDILLKITLKKNSDVHFTVNEQVYGIDELREYGLYQKILKTSPAANKNVYLRVSVSKDYKY